jgi:hypothetical protein
MTSETTDLIVFLRARLDEAEWRARAAKDAAAKRTHYRADMLASVGRELRDVEAKRAVVNAYAEVADNDINETEYAHGWANALGFAVRQFATEYADHPGYREEWRPDA